MPTAEEVLLPGWRSQPTSAAVMEPAGMQVGIGGGE